MARVLTWQLTPWPPSSSQRPPRAAQGAHQRRRQDPLPSSALSDVFNLNLGALMHGYLLVGCCMCWVTMCQLGEH